MRATFTVRLRDDVELEQALIRCVFVFIVTLYLWAYPQPVPLFHGSPRMVSLAYFIISIPVFLWIIARPGLNHPRRITFTVMDQVMVAYAASFGEHTIPIIAIAYWVIIGSGFRYGRGYLFLSTGAGMLGILYNMAFSPQWSEYLFIGLSYLLSILIVALYTTALLKRVTETNRKLTKSLNHVSTLARIDSLTGLPNRLALVERLTQSIAMTKRQRTCVALLYFDLDGFKAVNDTFGHNRGDALLIEVAKRVVPVMRATDTLARLGGDEFVIILESIRFPEDATLVANKVLGTVKEIAVVAADSVLGSLTALRISVSIGISAYVPSITPDAPSADILIKRADEAMYLAKQAGKGCYRVWTDNSALQHSIDTV